METEMDDPPKVWGYRVGYLDYYPSKKRPLPGPPFGLDDWRRYDWLRGWVEGRKLAKKHREELDALCVEMRATAKIEEERALALEEKIR